jgi:hypothetical protein
MTTQKDESHYTDSVFCQNVDLISIPQISSHLFRLLIPNVTDLNQTEFLRFEVLVERLMKIQVLSNVDGYGYQHFGAAYFFVTSET